MGYKTLYRKYRSQTFAEIVGQEHVIRVLKGALSRGRIAHAYLFSGPRGTGKTSVARIFAKALNCKDATGGDPCGKCHVCTSIAEGRAPDVIEMDAASNRGVEHIEELRRGVQFVPQELEYKVYIIDEVHMISTHGFNALLKTLEEPPSHAIFVLATTEPQKLPITILSRCLRFEFHRIPFRKLADHLLKLAELEGQAIRDDAAMLLAELAEGSARDAISLLDQLIIAGEEEITTPLVRELFGLTHPAAITDLVRYVLSGNLTKLLESFHSFVGEGRDPEHFLKLLYGKLRDGYLRTGDDDELLLMLENTDRFELLRAVEAVWESLVLLSRSNHPVNLIELTLFKIAGVFSGVSGRDYEPAIKTAKEPAAESNQPPAAQRPESASPAGSQSVSEPEKPIAEKVGDADFDPKAFLKNFTSGKQSNEAGVPAPRSQAQAEKKKTDLEPPDMPEPPEFTLPPDYETQDAGLSGFEQPMNDLPPTFSDASFVSDSDGESVEGQGAMPERKAALPRKKTGRRKMPDGFEEFPESKWDKILRRLENEYLATYCLLGEESMVTPVVLRPLVLYLAFPPDSLYYRSFAKEGRHRRAIEAITEEVMNSKWRIVFDPAEASDADISDEEAARIRAAQLDLMFGGSE